MAFHLYADDTQLYLAFNPKSAESQTAVIDTICSTVNAITNWMQANFLKLNSDKTEVIVITPPSVKQHSISSLSINNSDIEISQIVRDLGVQFDSLLKMEEHIVTTCRKAFYQIHLISKVRKYITEDSARTLVQTNVISLLDYCNCLLIGLPKNLIAKLQRVQNCAARLIKSVGKYDHITPVLRELHWLPIKYRIDYKVLLLTYKVINNLAPCYLKDLVTICTPTRQLRSTDQRNLCTRTFRLASYGGRTFAAKSPQLWNSLPQYLKHAESITIFKRQLKTYLFQIAFD
jgi:hypothetical protein